MPAGRNQCCPSPVSSHGAPRSAGCHRCSHMPSPASCTAATAGTGAPVAAHAPPRRRKAWSTCSRVGAADRPRVWIVFSTGTRTGSGGARARPGRRVRNRDRRRKVSARNSAPPSRAPDPTMPSSNHAAGVSSSPSPAASLPSRATSPSAPLPFPAASPPTPRPTSPPVSGPACAALSTMEVAPTAAPRVMPDRADAPPAGLVSAGCSGSPASGVSGCAPSAVPTSAAVRASAMVGAGRSCSWPTAESGRSRRQPG
ncbi:hypothetical protein ACFPT5_11710 [Ornithinimicrobium kibberense]